MSKARIKLIDIKGTGFLPDMGALKAVKVVEQKQLVYILDDEKAGSQNGIRLNEKQVKEI